MSDYEAMRAMYFKLVHEQANAIDVLQKTLLSLVLTMQEAEEIWINAGETEIIDFPKLHVLHKPTAER